MVSLFLLKFFKKNPVLEKKYEEYKKARGAFKMTIDEIRKLHYKEEGREEGRIVIATEMLLDGEAIEKIKKYSKLSEEGLISQSFQHGSTGMLRRPPHGLPADIAAQTRRVRWRMNARLLTAALGLLLLTGPALAQGAVPPVPKPPTATRTAAEQAAFTRGQALMTEFLGLRLARLWNTFSPDVQGQWGTLEGFTAFRKTGAAQYGQELRVVRERTFMQGKEAMYVRSSIYEKFPNQVWAFVMGFTGERVTTFGVLLEDERTDDPVALTP